MTQASNYYLRNNTQFCSVGDACIFFDLAENRYRYIGPQKARAIQRVANGSDNSITLSMSKDDVLQLDALSEANFLTKDHSSGKPILPTQHPKPHSAIGGEFTRTPVHVSSIIRLWTAHRSAERLINSGTTLNSLETATKLKERKISAERSVELNWVLEHARRLYSARNFVYSYHDKCFCDSLTFFLSLTRMRVAVSWVFGVSLHPFAAHCWVEHDGIVLNDTLDNVGRYTAIYVI